MAGKVECTITVDIAEVPLKEVSHLSVSQRMDGYHTFEFRMLLQDAKRSSFTDAAGKYLGKKAVLKINTAPVSTSSRDFSFTGMVTEVGFGRSQGGSPELIVTGHDTTFLLDGGTRMRSFHQLGLKQIVDTVCKDRDVEYRAAPKHTAQLPYVVQYEESDLRFLARMAARYGEWFFYDGDRIHFGKPADENVEELVFGRNLFRFDLGLAVRRNHFVLRHWHHRATDLMAANAASFEMGMDGDPLYGKLTKDPSDALFRIKDPAQPEDMEMLGHAADQGDLDARTRARKAATATRTMLLRGVSDHARLKPGKRVKVMGPEVKQDGMSDDSLDYGEFIVTAVSHSSSNGNYQNQFEAVPASSDLVPLAANHRQPVCDPQPAKVVEVDDPDKLGRVRVRFLWQEGGSELSPWIRVLQGHAHADGGAYLVPEKGSEVLVDFEFNDPEQPFVVGSFYNGRAKPDGAWAMDRNDVKAFRTRAGNEVVISDRSGKESIAVRNKDGKNELVLALGNEPTITLSTAGNIILDGKTITLKCQDLDIQARSSGKIKADSSLEIGSTTVNMDGDAAVTVKGGIIKLN